jgi:hypothetical protein
MMQQKMLVDYEKQEALKQEASKQREINRIIKEE